MSVLTTDEVDLDRWTGQLLNRHPAVGLAVGIVRDGAPAELRVHGLADLATGRPVTEDTVFRVASISKTFTAVAVMQLVERGLVDLDAPADHYLRAYRLVPRRPDWRPVTVRHLLTHTAGLGEETSWRDLGRRDFGESFPPGRVPTLARYYRGRLPVIAEPGTRFRYTDHGPTTVGQIVEDVSGQPFDAYLRARVFEPLGMTATDLVRSDLVRAGLATGYVLGRSGPEAVPLRDWVTAGGGGVYSSLRDMARYLAALLGGGANEHGRVLAPDTLAAMFRPQFQPDPRIPGLGLAFFRVDAGGHPVVEHQGILPGFDSQISVAPRDGVAVMAFTNGTRRGSLWLPSELGALLDDLIGVAHPAIRTDVPQRPDTWPDLCGRYHLPGPLTDVRMRGFVGAGATVRVRAGELWLRFLTPASPLVRGFALHPDDPADPYAFRVDLSSLGSGTVPIVFSRDGGTTALHLGVMPVTLSRREGARP
ncbi:serine hydrolase domain-containing protein [Trujillonella humicola]|uniref:serine hydrolase domain-containing protein n=1 Tax=Trujillonella humicola TaxID=3383699 RepID=UPI0039063CCA